MAVHLLTPHTLYLYTISSNQVYCLIVCWALVYPGQQGINHLQYLGQEAFTCKINRHYTDIIISIFWCATEFYFFVFVFVFILLLFKYSCLHFPLTTPHHRRHPHLPPLIPPHLGFVHVSFIVVPEILLFLF